MKLINQVNKLLEQKIEVEYFEFESLGVHYSDERPRVKIRLDSHYIGKSDNPRYAAFDAIQELKRDGITPHPDMDKEAEKLRDESFTHDPEEDYFIALHVRFRE